MKKFYRLCSFQFWDIGVKAFFVCIGLLLFQLITFSKLTFQDNMRLEQNMQRAGYSTMFFFAFALILIIINVSVYQRYFGTKSMYTIMSLPIRKAEIYLSFIIPGIIAVMMLCFTQIISVIISYTIMINGITGGIYPPFDIIYMNNSIFLSFVRYKYLRILLPLNFLDLARSICLLIVPVITVTSSAFFERSKKYTGIAIVIFQGTILWEIVRNINNTYISNIASIINVSISLLLCMACVFLTYHMIKNNEVV